VFHDFIDFMKTKGDCDIPKEKENIWDVSYTYVCLTFLIPKLCFLSYKYSIIPSYQMLSKPKLTVFRCGILHLKSFHNNR
jgi:hypothetical protein